MKNKTRQGVGEEEVLAECWNSGPTFYVAFDTVIADPRCAKSASEGECDLSLAACRFPAGCTVLLIIMDRDPPFNSNPHEYIV